VYNSGFLISSSELQCISISYFLELFDLAVDALLLFKLRGLFLDEDMSRLMSIFAVPTDVCDLAVDWLLLGVLRGVLLLLEVVDEDLLLELSNEGIPAC